MQSWLDTCRRRAPVLVGVCLWCISTAAAQTEPCTKFFVLPESNPNPSWHVDENWSPIGVPGPTDVVCILEEGVYQLTVTQPVTVAGLTFDVAQPNPKVKIIATDFTLNGFAYLGGDTKLKVNGGAVLRSDDGGSMEVRSKLVVEGGTVEIDVELYGSLTWWGTGSLTGTLVTHAGSTIEVEEPELDAHLTISESFDLNGAMIFNDTVNQSLTVTSGSLVNTATGTISTRVSGGDQTAVPELRAEVVNHGLIDLSGLDLRVSHDGSQHQNAVDGDIQIAGAELDIDLGGLLEVPSNFTNYGTVTVAGGGKIRIIGAAGAAEVPSNFTNYGTVTVASGGSIRIIGSSKNRALMSAVNRGFLDLESGGVFEVIAAIFENPAVGWVRGSGILDLAAAAGVVFDGSFSPGLSPGILTVEGSVNLGATAAIDIEIGGESPGSNLDRLDLTGALGAAGVLEVSLINPYEPLGGERFQILVFDHLDGWFDKLSLPQLMHMLAWNVDVGEHEVGLEVGCQGTQLAIDLVADRDPVSLGHEVLLEVTIANFSSVQATDVVAGAALPPELSFRQDLSSPECGLIGAAVECSTPSLAPGAIWRPVIAVEPVLSGMVESGGWVDAWECDTDASDDSATATIFAVAAEPCDANDDGSIDAGDLVPAVGHIFGVRADGNPDCRLANGITADDLAAIIVAGQ